MENKQRDQLEKKLKKHPVHTFNEAVRHAILGFPQELFRGGCLQFFVTLLVLGFLILIANLFNK